MRSRPPVGLVAPLLLMPALAGCGASTSTTGGAADDSARPPVETVEIVRTGGIAGVRDTLTIASDGSARVTTKDGEGRACKPAEKALTTLRATDLAAVAAVPREVPQRADGFTYTVRVGHQQASASEGEKDDRRADIVDVAAAVLTSCLAGAPAPKRY